MSIRNKSLNLLFVCSRNQWRSPTAENLWRRTYGVNVRSAGTSPKAKKTISVSDIQWSDVIFVMEKKHRQRIQANFSRLLQYKRMYVLDIPDEYHYMDEELIELLKMSVEPILEKWT